MANEPTAASSGPGAARARLIQPLRLRRFAFLWAGQGISVFGDQFYLVALPWLTLQITGSGLALGTVLMAAAGSRAVFMLPGGALSDRFSPRKLMILSNVARALLVGLLVALLVVGRLQFLHLYLLGLAFGTVDALFYPAYRAILPMLVGDDELEAGNALLQGTGQMAMLVGPAPAGLLIARAGLPATFGLAAASFALAAALLWAMPEGQRRIAGSSQQTQAASLWGDIAQGLRYAWRDPVIRAVLLIIAVLDFCVVGAADVGFPWLAERRFPQGAVALGAMFSAWGGGALLGTVIGGSIRRPRYLGPFFLGIAALTGLGLILVGFAPSLAWVTAILVAMGAGSGVLNVVGVSWLQARTDPSMLGRVMSLVMFASLGLSPLALALAGLVVDISATALFVGAGVIILLGMGAAALVPTMRRMA
ncbi:MAG: MFS transporter [Chloroflexi bacterium]|nr:MFS transporter [Chloroflexota bacterium]